jgi:hypothetical protein
MSVLRQLGWIDTRTRAVIIQLTLYNPSVQLFTSVTLLLEILSTGGMSTSARFQPISFVGKRAFIRICFGEKFDLAFTSIKQLVCAILYLMSIVYLMFIEMRLLVALKSGYVRRFWSVVNVGIICCSWTSLGIYLWRYRESQRIGRLFAESNGYFFINLQMSSYLDDLLTYLLGFCCFFGTVKLIELCRFDRRLCLFIQTLKYAGRELISFTMMTSVFFVSFTSLFHLLFHSKRGSCSSPLQTARALFEMTLMNFDAHQLMEAEAFLGPFIFALFMFLMVFVCMSMFMSIIHRHFSHSRKKSKEDKAEQIYGFMFRRLLGRNEVAGRRDDCPPSLKYFTVVHSLSQKTDQLLVTINRVCGKE